MNVNPNKFWDEKILKWEKDKYSPKLYDVNSSIKNRLQLAKSILKEIAPGRTVLELGCGSGLLAEDILSFGAINYIGVDISSVAIDAAKARLADNSKRNLTEFVVSDIQNIPSSKVDICFSLGLLDWLSLRDIEELNRKVDSQFYFHSFSEMRPLSLQQRLHQVYVFIMYGHKTNKYVPQYYTEKQIAESFKKSIKPIAFARPRNMSFGCFAYHLPNVPKALS